MNTSTLLELSNCIYRYLLYLVRSKQNYHNTAFDSVINLEGFNGKLRYGYHIEEQCRYNLENIMEGLILFVPMMMLFDH